MFFVKPPYCRDDGILSVSDQYVLRVEGGACSLKSEHLQPAAAGVYKCVAENRLGIAKCVARIYVKGL